MLRYHFDPKEVKVKVKHFNSNKQQYFSAKAKKTNKPETKGMPIDWGMAEQAVIYKSTRLQYSPNMRTIKTFEEI